MPKQFALFWMREGGCDAGTLLKEHQLELSIRERVLALAKGVEEGCTLRLELPFLNQREWRRRAEVLRATNLIRENNVIRNMPANPGAALRDRAAMLLALHPAWRGIPEERDPRYSTIWQRVSVALQKTLKEKIAERYFADIERFEDREMAGTMLVYQVSRPFYGRARTDYTYDIADDDSLARAWRMTGAPLQARLVDAEQRLHEAGKSELARRYAPIWSEDILRGVQKRPRAFMALIAKEAMFVNALIELGTSRKMAAVKPFSKMAGSALRNVAGLDMRDLALPLLEEATIVLKGAMSGAFFASEAGGEQALAVGKRY